MEAIHVALELRKKKLIAINRAWCKTLWRRRRRRKTQEQPYSITAATNGICGRRIVIKSKRGWRMRLDRDARKRGGGGGLSRLLLFKE